MESHWFQREDGFARLLHRLDCFLVTGRGSGRAEMTVGIYDHRNSRGNGCSTDPGNVSRAMSCLGPDANGFGLGSNANIADVDIVTARGEVHTCGIADSN